MTKHAGGRPTKITDITLKKLEDAFSMGCSDVEACLMANISQQTLYNYQKKNPEFVTRKIVLKDSPMLKARKTIVNSLDEPRNAQWYAERKKKKEFSTRTEQDITTKGEKITGFNYISPDGDSNNKTNE